MRVQVDMAHRPMTTYLAVRITPCSHVTLTRVSPSTAMVTMRLTSPHHSKRFWDIAVGGKNVLQSGIKGSYTTDEGMAAYLSKSLVEIIIPRPMGAVIL